jgi:predicted nuclease of restriction endonuclease-like (RecB) superfamily
MGRRGEREARMKTHKDPEMTGIIKKPDYKNLLNDISRLVEGARRRAAKQVNTIIVQTYWEIGRLIVEDEQKGEEKANYGTELIVELSKDLTKRYGKGFSKSNLFLMRKFYSTYPPQKFQTVSGKFNNGQIHSWSHYCELTTIKDDLARSFYEIESIKNNWSVRELKRQINSLLFERLALSKDKDNVMQLAQEGQVIEKPEDAIKDPYVLEFLGLPERSCYTESQLEQELTNHLQEFILELGKGFTFVGRQKRITIDNEHYYVDLIFYHRMLRCLVLIDLKIGKLTHADVGQMNFYLNYIKDQEMLEDENLPVGIILCTEPNRSKVFVEYALGGLSNNVFVSKYKLYLPTKSELEVEIQKESTRLSLIK